MAGHSKYKNIMHRKGAQDKRKAKIRTKYLHYVRQAAKSGQPNIDTNSALRHAVNVAKKHNIPNDQIDAAIKKASSKAAGDEMNEMVYEGYGPAGTAFIVETLSDNKNRTAGEIRSTFKKYGGALGAQNSVTYLFDNIGRIQYDINASDSSSPLNDDSDDRSVEQKYEDMLEFALSLDALDCTCEDDWITITTAPALFHSIRESFIDKYGPPNSDEIVWLPQSFIQITDEQQDKIIKFTNALESFDDVQNIYSNCPPVDNGIDE